MKRRHEAGEKMGSNNVIFGINGPVVTIRGTKDFVMKEQVHAV